MIKFTATISFLLSVLTAQVTAPFELELRTRLVNNDRTMVNIQITNLMDKPLDYVEGFVIEKYIKDSRDWVNTLTLELDTLNYSKLIEDKYLKYKDKN